MADQLPFDYQPPVVSDGNLLFHMQKMAGGTTELSAHRKNNYAIFEKQFEYLYCLIHIDISHEPPFKSNYEL